MSAITETTTLHSAGSEAVSPKKGVSPNEPAQKSPVVSDKSSSPSKLPADDSTPAPDHPEGSAKQNGEKVSDAKGSENGTEQPALEVSGDAPANASSEKPLEDVDQANKAADKREESGTSSEAAGEVEKQGESRQESREGEEVAAGCDSCESAAEKDTGDVEQKVDLIKLDASPKVQSPPKTSCAAV